MKASARQETTGPAHDADWARLRDIVRTRSFSQGQTRTLASGATSSFYFDMKKTLADPEGGLLIARLMLKAIGNRPCAYVGGLEMGAVPIAAGLSLLRAVEGAALPFFWVRKQPKDHGTQSLIEGPRVEELSGRPVIVVEDVTTTGESSMKAVGAVRAAGGVVDTVVTIVDRLEGARDNMRARGIELVALFTADDFR